MKRSVFFVLAVTVLVGVLFVSRTRSAPQVPNDLIEEAKRKAEEHQKAAIRIDDLAASIHSEEDARAFIDAIGKAFEDEIPYGLTTPVRTRLAHAEYASVSDPSKLIPEQRVVDAWNHWIADINGPAQARLTVAELHLLRETFHLNATSPRPGTSRTLWNLRNTYALKPNGRVADGCRPVEAFLLLHHINTLFQNVMFAREFIAQGKSIDEEIRKREELEKKPVRYVAYLSVGTARDNTVQTQLRDAEENYFEKHGPNVTTARVLQLVSEVLADQ
jgi:hypothetical protein